MNKTHTCPTCKKNLLWDENNEHRPFCCERCKLIDLGRWANDEYTIAEEPQDIDD